MKITKLRISNYRGIEALETAIPPSGAVFAGGNARGKTTCVNAIKACLTAQEVSSDAVRIGADKSELLIDLDDHTVKRAISRNAPSKLTVERSGMKASKPTAYLTELLGTSSLDPLDFYLADAKKRKAQILAALPVTVTLEQLRKYAPDLAADFDVSGHGLEVVERAKKFFYDERTLANKDVAEAKANAERLAAEAQRLAAAVAPGVAVPADQARADVAAREREIVTLQEQARAASELEARSEGQRARIAKLREDAAKALEGVPEEADTAALRAELVAADAKVAEVADALAKAREAREVVSAKLKEATNANDLRERALFTAKSRNATADELAAALAEAAVAGPSAETLNDAQERLAAARAAEGRAAAQATALEAARAATLAKGTLQELEGEAAELDQTVKRLANDAPTELLAAAEGIPGLSIEGDDVLLDGKRLDALSGAEQLKFAVEVARRANAKSKILVVDGLERLDPEQMEAFVALATRDDWQLLASRVSAGDLVIEAIEPDARAAAAE